MKLIIEATSKNSMGAVHDLVDEQRFVIARCGGTEDAQEIVRRVNAHDALVAACEEISRRLQGSIVNQDLRDQINAALALAQKEKR